MPRHLLTAKQIVAAHDRDLVDGEGLIVCVKENSCTAVLRFTSPLSRREERYEVSSDYLAPIRPQLPRGAR
jgi:hypothetical protein